MLMTSSPETEMTCCDWETIQVPTTQLEARKTWFHAEKLLEAVDRDSNRFNYGDASRRGSNSFHVHE